MLIDQHTKIAFILREHPGALDAITSISPGLEKLRNPFLRKLMAGRTSIRMAAKVSGCTEEDFFRVLEPLGFESSQENKEKEEKQEKEKTQEKDSVFPPILTEMRFLSLDVRPLIQAGNDPLKQIMGKIKALKQGEALKIINTFEPSPLIAMLKKKGFQFHTEILGPDHIETWFFRVTEESAHKKDHSSSGTEGAWAVAGEGSEEADIELPQNTDQESWGQLIRRFNGRLQEIDVRALEMPQPMIRILESLEELPEGKALFVHHKRIPVYLLPELAQRNFDYRSREISANEVQLLIFRN